ncbi:MAG: YicC family protein [Clostridia bacterium]|nr:YicC family protein [Clostridia bacterium]
MRSMTGYGKAEYKCERYSLTVEIKTVNNRFLDLNTKYPRFLTAIDDVIRRSVSSNVKRGKADLYVSFEKVGESLITLTVDESLAKAYYEASNSISSVLGIKNDFTVSSLMKSPDVVKQSQVDVDVETLAPIVENTIIEACKNLNKMREFEGEKLKADLLSRIDTIEETVLKIQEYAPTVAEEYRLKLKERLNEILKNTEIDETRLLQETAIFVDKSNIDEELTRLKSHISQFRKICEGEGETGKKLDFLVQEFNRESNTVCSKSNSIFITDNALKLKCEIEKIREQIQNIE